MRDLMQISQILQIGWQMAYFGNTIGLKTVKNIKNLQFESGSLPAVGVKKEK